MNSIILAGGKGSRLKINKNKSSLTFLSNTLLDHNIKLLKSFSESIIIVGGYYFEDLLKYQHNKEISLIFNNAGIINALKQGIETINSDYFILCFSDELVIDASLNEMVRMFHDNQAIAVIGYCERNSETEMLIHNTFSIEVENHNKIINVVEKPKTLVNRKQGTSYAVISKSILKYITEETKNYPEILQAAIDNNENIFAVEFCKEFFNNNTPQDLTRMEKFEQNMLGNFLQ
jgi:NDP-sugar pyrophosphorylase family protein